VRAGGFRLTPLYDVMSAQPNVDAGEIRHNAMKLAMTVGDSRHYVIDSIMPRHFLQTAANAAYPRLSSKAFSTKSKTKRIARLRLQWTACPPDFRNGSFHRSLRACTGVCSPRATT